MATLGDLWRSPWSRTLASSGLIVLVGALTGIVSARLLGPEDRGTLAVLMLWPGLIAGLGLLSLPDAVVFREGRGGSVGLSGAATVLATAAALALVTAGVGCLLLPWLLTGTRAAWLGTAQLFLLGLVLANHLGLALLALDHAEQRMGRYNLTRLLPSSIYLAGLVALWATGRLDVATALWATLAGSVTVVVVQWWWWRRHLWSGRPHLATAATLLRCGLGFHGAAVLAMLGQQADRVLAATLLDDRAIGLYAVALTMTTAAQGVITTSAQIVLLPRLAAGGTAATVGFGRGLRQVSSAQLLVAVALVAAMPWVLPLLFGVAFADAVPTAMLLALAGLPLALRQVIGRAIRGLGDARGGLMAEATALAAFLPLAWLGLTRLGLPGLALALLAANLLALAVLLAHLARRHGLPPGHCLGLDRAELAALAAMPFRRARHHG